MKIDRYLFFATLAIMIGIALSWQVHTGFLVAGIMALMAGLVIKSPDRFPVYVALLLFCLVIGCIYSASHLEKTDPESHQETLLIRVEEQKGQRYIARILESQSGTLMKKKIWVSSRHAMDIGKRYRVTVEFDSFNGQRIPNGFNENTFYLSHQVYYKAHITGAVQEIAAVDAYGRLLLFREQLLEKNDALYKDKAQSFVRAIIFGDKSLLDQELSGAFQALGLSHLLAVSGLHAGIIAAIIYRLCMSGGFYLRNFAVIAVLVLYAFLAGFSPSVNRAVLMFILAVIGKCTLRYLDPYTIIATSALCQILINPFVIFSVGFQLSYTTLLSIIAISEKITIHTENLPKWKEYVLIGIRTSAAATFGSAPIVLYYFNKLPFIGILMNLIYIPMFSVLTFIAIAGLPLAWFEISQAKPLYDFASYCFNKILQTTEKLADLAGIINLSISSPAVWELMLYYVLLYLVVCRKKPDRKLLLSVLIVLLISIPLQKKWEFTVLDVGQGDALYINTRNEKIIVIDGGPWGREVESFLNSNGINRPDIYLLSHPHHDHSNGLLWLMERKPPKVLMVPKGCTEPAQEQLVEMALAKNVRVIELYAGKKFSLDQTSFTVLSPEKGRYYRNVNNQSLVLLVSYRNQQILLTGDAEKDVLERLQIKVPIDLLKAPHHGSNTGASTLFFSRHQIKKAVIPVGERNRYGHPGEAFMGKMEKHNINVERTDHSGSVSYIIDRNGAWKVKKIIE